jgi:hypothetical protein
MIAGVGCRAWFGVRWVVINDLKIWLFARSEESKNIKKTCKKAEPFPGVLRKMGTWVFIFKEQGISSKYILGTREIFYRL